ncbi:AIR synthase related protein, partial [Neisseria sicca]|uniref:AIR synthase related protein n=1 Tax=Neisseria sicca TaxID=490 RepID=UPI0021C13F88
VSAEDLGWKMVGVKIWDMGGMGGVGKWVVVSGGLGDLEEKWVRGFWESFFSLGERLGITLIGGDTRKGDLVLKMTIVGELPEGEVLGRDAGEEGDD